MTDKERITEILKAYTKKHNIMASSVILEEYAEELLANGVIVPPCKVGAKVYVITSQTSNGENLYIFEDIITHYVVCDNYTLMCFENHIAEANHNWDKVFLTKEEAEQALKEQGK